MHGGRKNPEARRSVSACHNARCVAVAHNCRTGMRSGSLLANGMRPPSVAQYDKTGANVTISVFALSVIVDRHPAGVQSPSPPIRTCVTLDYSKAIRPVVPPSKNKHPRTELLVRKPLVSVRRGQPPILLAQSNTREPLSHPSSRAFVLGPLLQHPPYMLHPSETQKPPNPRSIRPPKPHMQAIIQVPPSPHRSPIRSST